MNDQQQILLKLMKQPTQQEDTRDVVKKEHTPEIEMTQMNAVQKRERIPTKGKDCDSSVTGRSIKHYLVMPSNANTTDAPLGKNIGKRRATHQVTVGETKLKRAKNGEEARKHL